MGDGVGRPTGGMGGLSARERDVLRLMAQGRNNREIADELFIGECTVKSHISHLFTKLSARDRVGAVLRAFELGVVDTPGSAISRAS